jgi:hypothetical protein
MSGKAIKPPNDGNTAGTKADLILLGRRQQIFSLYSRALSAWQMSQGK